MQHTDSKGISDLYNMMSQLANVCYLTRVIIVISMKSLEAKGWFTCNTIKTILKRV